MLVAVILASRRPLRSVGHHRGTRNCTLPCIPHVRLPSLERSHWQCCHQSILTSCESQGRPCSSAHNDAQVGKHDPTLLHLPHTNPSSAYVPAIAKMFQQSSGSLTLRKNTFPCPAHSFELKRRVYMLFVVIYCTRVLLRKL
jgi:hypothetical protein